MPLRRASVRPRALASRRCNMRRSKPTSCGFRVGRRWCRKCSTWHEDAMSASGLYSDYAADRQPHISALAPKLMPTTRNASSQPYFPHRCHGWGGAQTHGSCNTSRNWLTPAWAQQELATSIWCPMDMCATFTNQTSSSQIDSEGCECGLGRSALSNIVRTHCKSSCATLPRHIVQIRTFPLPCFIVLRLSCPHSGAGKASNAIRFQHS